MKIKNPPVYDLSHWEIISDFSAIQPRPALIITKATESLQGIDGKFIEYFAGMKAAGISRGAYHFFRRAYDAVSQAKHFLETVKPHINDSDILALDIEEGGETAAQIIQFCDFVQTQCPQNLLMIYSRKNILDVIPMTQAQKDRLKKLPVWTAGYPYEPDMFDSVPVMYIPDQTKWGAVWLWQYSDRGIVTGVKGEVDLNWIAPELLEKLDVFTPSYDGISSLLATLENGAQIRFERRG